MNSSKESGFTLVELLVTTGIVGIMATLAIAQYQEYQDRAKYAVAKIEIVNLATLSTSVKQLTNRNLRYITGHPWSKQACLGSASESDGCYNRSFLSFNNIFKELSGNATISREEIIDPWGRPYWLNENEGDAGNSDPCIMPDIIGTHGPSYSTLSDDLKFHLPMGSGCEQFTLFNDLQGKFNR